MHGAVGDRLVVRSRTLGAAGRHCCIVDVRGEAGSPPYVVRWDEDGHEGLYVPGPDATLEPATPLRSVTGPGPTR